MSKDLGEVATRQVRDRQELIKALALVHDNYVRCGYMEPDPAGIRLSIHYAIPTARTFVSVLRGEVIATLSLFCDSPLGLPMDDLYEGELRALRQQGRRIGEVGMLADRRTSFSRSVPVFLALMKRVYWASKDAALSDMLITVNPKHKAFYMRMFCFEEYGSERSYGAVNGAPAVALRIDLAALRVEDQRERVQRTFFSPLPEGDAFKGSYQMRAEDIEYFFLERTDILQRADTETVSLIEGLYPGLHLERVRKEPAI